MSSDRHFATDHLLSDLKGRSVRGGAVTLGAQGIKFVLQLVSTVVLARLLTPADFGLVAMVTALTGFVAMFKDAGLSMATVQRDHITHAQVSTLFWVNVGLSAALMLLVAACAPAIAWFYGKPELVAITLVTAGTFIFGGLSVQHTALMKRQMRFSALATKDIISMAAGIVAAIVLAFLGAGYWSLVAMPAAAALAGMILAWLMSGWRPGLPRRGCGVRSMLAFGANLSGSSFLNYIGSNVDKILIGWQFGPASLGIYERAYRLTMLPISQANAPLRAVAIPALSRALNNDDKYARGFLSTLQRLMLLVAPAMAFAALCADWLIQIFLGPQWTEAVPIFATIAVGAILLPLANATSWLLVSQGRTKEELWWQAITNPIRIILCAAAIPWGILGVSIAIAARHYISTPIRIWIVCKRGPVRASQIYAAMAIPATATILTLVVVLAVRSGIPPTLPPTIGVTASAIGACLAVTISLLCNQPGRGILKEILKDSRMLYLVAPGRSE